ncbi:MAG TPA: hypothetical protein VM143_06445 [Acidimicrobiales bacterium]|nr:hypothetical protein [Acidimicrobiales bacterium]
MELLFTALPLVGCAAMSLWCHRRMSKGNCAPNPKSAKIATLRAEVETLRAERTVGGRR